MSVKDMYADLEKIEERGKRKKKSKGLFSPFSKKDEPELEQPEAVPEPVPEKPVENLPKDKPAPNPTSNWKPLSGGKLKAAEEELLKYKKWLNKGFKSGMLTKEQCVENVTKKEIELGLRASE